MANASFGELGYELCVGREDSNDLYKSVKNIGLKYNLKDAGYRAFSSLNCEKGL